MPRRLSCSSVIKRGAGAQHGGRADQAELRGELGRMLGIPDHDVGDLAGLDAAENLAQAERARGIAGHAEQRLLGREAESVQASVHVELQRGERRAARIEVARDCDRHAVARAAVRSAAASSRAGSVYAPGSSTATVRGGGHGQHAVLVEVLEVIGGERLVLRGEGGALLVGELLGVQLDREPEFLARSMNTRSTCAGREADVLAEGVHRVREPGLGGRGRISSPTHLI